MTFRPSHLAFLSLLFTASAHAQAPYDFKEALPIGGFPFQSFASSDTRLVYGNRFNGDTRDDLVVKSRGAVAVYANQSDGTFVHYWSTVTEPTSAAVGAVNIDGGNWADLLLGSSPHKVHRFANTHNGFSIEPLPIDLQSAGRHPMLNDLAVADFNRDGKMDFVALDTDPANPDRSHTVGPGTVLHRASAALLWGQGGGGFAADSARPRVPVAEYPLRARIVDLNNDTNPDVITNNGSSLSFLQNFTQSGGLLNVGGVWPLTPGSSLHSDILGLATGDFNADDKIDLAVTYYNNMPPNGRAYRLKIYRNTTPLPNLAVKLEPGPQEITLPAPGNGVAIADFNGDTINDVIVGLESAGQPSIALYAGNGDFTFDPPVYINGGFSAGELVVGNFNADSLPDIAVVDLDNNRVVTYLHR